MVPSSTPVDTTTKSPTQYSSLPSPPRTPLAADACPDFASQVGPDESLDDLALGLPNTTTTTTTARYPTAPSSLVRGSLGRRRVNSGLRPKLSLNTHDVFQGPAHPLTAPVPGHTGLAPALNFLPPSNRHDDISGWVNDLNVVPTFAGPLAAAETDSIPADEEAEDLDMDDLASLNDEDSGLGGPASKVASKLSKRKMKRFRLTHSQTRYLMSEFSRQAHPDAAQRERLCREIPGLTPRQVQVWFQNRRAKLKRLSAEDRDRILQSRALPENFNMAQTMQPSYAPINAPSAADHLSLSFNPSLSPHSSVFTGSPLDSTSTHMWPKSALPPTLRLDLASPVGGMPTRSYSAHTSTGRFPHLTFNAVDSPLEAPATATFPVYPTEYHHPQSAPQMHQQQPHTPLVIPKEPVHPTSAPVFEPQQPISPQYHQAQPMPWAASPSFQNVQVASSPYDQLCSPIEAPGVMQFPPPPPMPRAPSSTIQPSPSTHVATPAQFTHQTSPQSHAPVPTPQAYYDLGDYTTVQSEHDTSLDAQGWYADDNQLWLGAHHHPDAEGGVLDPSSLAFD